ncbi:hypothetical protein BAOM_2965 [Peribacillus asahii]|uniref:Uncharacterized protein n=1 Tax=Peribacillus asahii TaxID=228899 RepID=A0A3Q9RP58_9BACI|nr:hypothetical protein [Peribacillus asahii]AZV43574.1 hypothetical protein BAOM_2965 [Peribacillus asahii]
MNKEKLKEFIRELNRLQEKHGIYISAGYDEMIDYNWDEEPYVSGVQSYLVFSDKEGNEKTLDDLDIDDLADI